MGTCASSPEMRSGENTDSPSAMAVDLDGRLQEFRRLITVAEVLSLHPNCYICCADAMFINSNAPQLPKDHVLQLGQIYFLMPLSKSPTPLSLEDLCVLAIRAGAAMNGKSGAMLHEYRRLGIPGIMSRFN